MASVASRILRGPGETNSRKKQDTQGSVNLKCIPYKYLKRTCLFYSVLQFAITTLLAHSPTALSELKLRIFQ
jgi:hypothetical protein